MTTLPQTISDLNDITTSTKCVVVLYGRKSDGTLIALNTGDTGDFGAKFIGSSNAYFSDQTINALTGVFVSQPFSFASFNISLINDDGAETIEYSFDGTNIHGRLTPSQYAYMPYREQSGIYLRTVSGNPANYRLTVY